MQREAFIIPVPSVGKQTAGPWFGLQIMGTDTTMTFYAAVCAVQWKQYRFPRQEQEVLAKSVDIKCILREADGTGGEG